MTQLGFFPQWYKKIGNCFHNSSKNLYRKNKNLNKFPIIFVKKTKKIVKKKKIGISRPTSPQFCDNKSWF
jgi:hypothetical protein